MSVCRAVVFIARLFSGLPVDENAELTEELIELGVSVGEHVIPSIRSIAEIQPTATA